MDKLALAEEVLVRLQRGKNPERFAEDLDAFLKDPACWRKATSGLAVPARDEQAYMRNIYRELGLEVAVPSVPKLTDRQVKSLSRFGFRLFYIPAITEDAYPVSFVKPNWDQYRCLHVTMIERRPLPGKWVAVETIAKPDWKDPEGYPEGYPEDRLAAAVKIKSRFDFSFDDLHQEGGLLEKIAKVTGFPRKRVRLPSVEEWNFLANLFRKLIQLRGEILPDLGRTYSWEWCLNSYGSDDRWLSGGRGLGDLAVVFRGWHGGRDSGIGFRVLAVL